MLRSKHVLPLALLVSVSVFAMEEQVDLVWQKNPEGILVKVTEATAAKPVLSVTWAKQDGKYVATEGIEVSTPLAREERPVDLLSTHLLTVQHTEQQSFFNKLQQDKDAAIKAEADQLAKLKVMSIELARKLTAKQTAEAGSNLNIANFEKQIAQLLASKEEEIAIQTLTVTDIKILNAAIQQTNTDVAAAEAAKQAEAAAAEAAKKAEADKKAAEEAKIAQAAKNVADAAPKQTSGWWPFGRSTPVATPAAAEASATK